jgi:hypothetical protein
MPKRTGLSFATRTLLVITSWTCFSHEVEARPPTVSVGEVTVKSAGADVPTERRLRFLLGREIDRLRLDTLRRSDTYVLSASLVRLDAHESGDGARVNCVVSATLRQARTGTLLAMLRGSGTVEDDRDMLEGAKERALEAAVYGAVRRLPEAL